MGSTTAGGQGEWGKEGAASVAHEVPLEGLLQRAQPPFARQWILRESEQRHRCTHRPREEEGKLSVVRRAPSSVHGLCQPGGGHRHVSPLWGLSSALPVAVTGKLWVGTELVCGLSVLYVKETKGS